MEFRVLRHPSSMAGQLKPDHQNLDRRDRLRGQKASLRAGRAGRRGDFGLSRCPGQSSQGGAGGWLTGVPCAAHLKWRTAIRREEVSQSDMDSAGPVWTGRRHGSLGLVLRRSDDGFLPANITACPTAQQTRLIRNPDFLIRASIRRPFFANAENLRRPRPSPSPSAAAARCASALSESRGLACILPQSGSLDPASWLRW